MIWSFVSAEVDERAAPADATDDILDLIVRLRLGERSALAEAYDRHHDALRAFATRLVGDAATAEDLVHEVFLALPSAIRRFEGRSSLRTFLVSIAARQCGKYVRSAVRRRRAHQRASEDRARSDSVALPSERVLRAELADALERGLDELPIEQRVAFTLVAIEERTSKDAADILGIPEATVRTRAMRAREKLREHLTEAGVS